MTLGLAAILIFVLYLIDKHSRWKQAFKFLCWTAGLAVVGFGLFYAFSFYSDLHINHSQPLKIVSSEPLPSSAKKSTAEHPVWIYIDDAEEFDGFVSTRPKVPKQISDMIAKTQDCVPGSWTFGEDKTQWVCVEPRDPASSMTPDAITVPIESITTAK
jgi:hypothetical protein